MVTGPGPGPEADTDLGPIRPMMKEVQGMDEIMDMMIGDLTGRVI